MLGSVPAETIVGRLTTSVVFVPRRLPATFPALRDRVADEDQLMTALLGLLNTALVAGLPPGFTHAVSRGD